MNKFNTKIIYPLVGSIGLTAYLFDNNKYVLNYKNRKLIEDLQFRSTILVMEHFQINKTYGNVLTTTIERESVLDSLNKTKTSLNFEMKIKKGKSFDLDDYFAQVYVNTSMQDTKWNIDSLDIQFVNTRPKILKRLYESLDTPISTDYESNLKKIDKTYKDISESSRLCLEQSKECLDELKQNLPFVLQSIHNLLIDDKKLNTIGEPIVLKLDSIHINDRITVKIRVNGGKQIANLFISGEREKSTYEFTHIGVMFELEEDLYLSTSELANKYVEKITSENSQFKEIAENLNIAKLIEDKLFNNSRALNSIGRPIYLDNFSMRQLDKSGVNQLVLKFKGKLNSANLVIDLINKENDNNRNTNKWMIEKCNLKMVWH